MSTTSLYLHSDVILSKSIIIIYADTKVQGHTGCKAILEVVKSATERS